MPFLTRGNARIYYEEVGHGDPVILIHGLVENASYWSICGVAGRLADSNFRVISMDMRGHGRTEVVKEPFGFDVETVGEDILALAEHLGLGRFHLVGHSTGGFASCRLAMKESGRFATLILTNTSSATSSISDPVKIRKFLEAFARSFEKNTWDQILAFVKKNNEPLFRGIVESDRADELLGLFRTIMELNDRQTIAAFVRSFFTDPDPRVEGLRGIRCPVLVIWGDKDDLFAGPSKLMAKEIPGARAIEYKGIGHITALESPERLAADLIDFMKAHPA